MATQKPARKNKGGRPKGSLGKKQHPLCKLTEGVLKQFVEEVRRGNFRTVARQRLGISQSTYDQWMRTGRKQIREYHQGKRSKLLLQGRLVIELDRAEGYIHGQMVQDILEQGSIHARMWYLERRFRKLYNPHAIATDDETGKEIEVDASSLLADKLKALLPPKDE